MKSGGGDPEQRIARLIGNMSAKPMDRGAASASSNVVPFPAAAGPSIQAGRDVNISVGLLTHPGIATQKAEVAATAPMDRAISFDPRFLRDQGAAPDACALLWAQDDSMMPTIPDGSALIVDQSQTEAANGSIIVIGVGADMLVKRIRRRLDGQTDLISDNSAYAPETLGPDALQQLRVVGRVVYFCRTP